MLGALAYSFEQRVVISDALGVIHRIHFMRGTI